MDDAKDFGGKHVFVEVYNKSTGACFHAFECFGGMTDKEVLIRMAKSGFDLNQRGNWEIKTRLFK